MDIKLCSPQCSIIRNITSGKSSEHDAAEQIEVVIPLTEDEIEAVYRFREHQYLLEDATAQITSLLNNTPIIFDIFPNLITDLKNEGYYETLVEKFSANYNSDVSEHDQWETVCCVSLTDMLNQKAASLILQNLSDIWQNTEKSVIFLKLFPEQELSTISKYAAAYTSKSSDQQTKEYAYQILFTALTADPYQTDAHMSFCLRHILKQETQQSTTHPLK